MVLKNGSQKTMNLRCTPQLIKFLKMNASYGETLESVIWRLFNKRLIDADDKKGIPSEYESKVNGNKKRRKG